MGSCSGAQRPPGGGNAPRLPTEKQSVAVQYDARADNPTVTPRSGIDSADLQSCIESLIDPGEEQGGGGAPGGGVSPLMVCHSCRSSTPPTSPPPHGGRVPADLAQQCPEVSEAPFIVRGTESISSCSFDFLRSADLAAHLAFLRRGGTLFAHASGKGSDLLSEDLEFLRMTVNLSAFGDEQRQNGCPALDPYNVAERSPLTFILAKAMFLMPPPLDLSHMNVDLFTSRDYRRFCEPAAKIHEPLPQDGSGFLRITKAVVPMYSLTVQWRVTEIHCEAERRRLSALCGGVQVHRAILMERTKRDPTKRDKIVKVKNIHMFHRLAGGGMLCVSTTSLVARSLPGILSGMIVKLGPAAAQDYSETATNMRRYVGKTVSERRQCG